MIIIRNLGKSFQSLEKGVAIPFQTQLLEKASLKRVEKIYFTFDVSKMAKISKTFEQTVIENLNNLEMKNNFLKVMFKKKSIIDVGY